MHIQPTNSRINKANAAVITDEPIYVTECLPRIGQFHFEPKGNFVLSLTI